MIDNDNYYFEIAIKELKESLKLTWLYKILIKLLDWLSEKLEK